MRTLHKHLKGKLKWYDSWHNFPHHNTLHWTTLFIALVVSLSLTLLLLTDNTTKIKSSSANNETQGFAKKLYKGKDLGYASDRILVKFKKGISDSKRKDIIKRNNLAEKSEITGSKVKILSIKAGQNAKNVAANIRIKEKSSIEFAEADRLISPEALPGDQYYFEQWFYKKIQAEDAWDNAKASNISIAICDTGFDQTHVDLRDSYQTNLGFNTVDDNTNWSNVNAHGTVVAGIAAGTTDNIVGIAGTAWGGYILPVRISNSADGSAYISDAAECITYAANNGSRVINLSYLMANSPTIDAAASYAETKGAVTVVAAGNSGINTGWTDYTTFLAVGATTKDDVRATWSNYGTFIDLVAPGDSILGTYPPTNSYAFGTGTSMAAPIVSGALGLMFGEKPSLTPQEAKNIIMTSTDDLGAIGEDIEYGAGRLNVRKAIEKTLGITISPSNPDNSNDSTLPTTPLNLRATVVSPYQIDLTWEPSMDNVIVKGYDVFRARYCSGFSFTRIAQTTKNSYSDPVLPSTCYEYYVRSVDSSGNVSYNSAIIKAQTESVPKRSTPPPTPTPTPKTDFIVPSAPSSVTGKIISSQNVGLSWKGSRDNIGISTYRIYVPGWPDINGVRKPNLSQVVAANFKTDESAITYSYTASGAPLEPRTYWIAAVDEAGNISEMSDPVNITTPGLEGYGNFKGKVLDSAGKPPPGNGVTYGAKVMVTLAGTRTTQGSFANADGSFLIPSLPVGTHKLSITLKGYTSINSTVTIPNKDTYVSNYAIDKR